jgi:hydrogenase maturation protease
LKEVVLKYLFLGYGNIDRQDDGVAWHLLCEVMNRLNYPPPIHPEDEMPIINGDYTFDFQLQLTPELADSMGEFDRVCFMDAHTGNVPQEVHIENVKPQYQSSPFTHHMTAATVLSLCDVIHHYVPATILISVRGYEFKFTRSLSSNTASLIPAAADAIIKWTQTP